MNDGRWTAFSIVNNILLVFHLLYLLFSLSGLTMASGLEIPFLFELYLILPPVAGIINARFNHSVIRRNYHAAVPLSSTKKNWQLLITLVYLVAAVLILLQLTEFLNVVSEDGRDKDVNLVNFIRVLIFLFSLLSIYLVAFQLIAARNAGSSPENSEVAAQTDESENEECQEDDDKDAAE
jgi:hypothetical protein